MNIIGVDASTKSTGVSVFIENKFEKYELIRSSDENPYKRIEYMYKNIKDIVCKYDINYIFIENVPLSKTINKQVAEHLLVLQGTILSIAIEKNCGIIPMPPSNWRKLANVKAEGRKREDQKKAAIQIVREKYNIQLKWESNSLDIKTGDSDIAESILIGVAGIKYLDNLDITGKKMKN